MNQKKYGWVSVLILVLTACASHPKKVACEEHLRPINAPAPVAREGAGHP